MKTIDFSYFIERYNAGEMNEAEKQWFRKELDGSPVLKEDVELRAKTDRILQDHSLLLLRNKLKAIEKQRAQVTTKAPDKTSPIRYAAVIAVLILLGSILFMGNRNMSNTEIMGKFYQPYDGISASRSVESMADNDYVTALEYYNTRDYRSAAVYFNKVLKGDPNDMGSVMLYGVSNFEEMNYPVAKQSFTKVVENNDNLYIEDAQWYLALCYIQTDENALAVDQLNAIRNSESIYRKEARRILRKIK